MKRVTYISKFSRKLSPEEIEEISQKSQQNNHKKGITGVLLCYADFFFQIIEGETEKVDRLYEKILADNRHTNILCLKAEENVQERLFPQWSMHTINLDCNTSMMLTPLKTLLHTITESHLIIEKYTPKTIYKMIERGINPLAIPPSSVDRIVVFCDLVGFSTFTEKIPVIQVVYLVNTYFTICTQAISQNGGEVTKFIGDCVMATFPDDKTDAAITASLEILNELAELRNSAPTYSPLKFLYSGIGLSKGKVIQGNMGSSMKKDFTIIGDAVNVAQRIEALTRHLPRFLAFSSDVKVSTQLDWDFVAVDHFQPKGKEEILAIYSVNDDRCLKKKEDIDIIKDLNFYLNDL
ncbi:MAG: BLUF domain-containing protein [Halothece sp.]